MYCYGGVLCHILIVAKAHCWAMPLVSFLLWNALGFYNVFDNYESNCTCAWCSYAQLLAGYFSLFISCPLFFAFLSFSASVSLSSCFIIAVLMRKCWGQRCCTSFTFSITILNRCLFALWCQIGEGGWFVIFRLFKSIFFSVEFHCISSIYYKILPYFVYYFCIQIR